MKTVKYIPELRFPEFEGEWISKHLGDYYSNLSSGMTPSRLKPKYFKGDILWITSGELNFNFIANTKEKITEQAVKDTNLKIYPPYTFFIAITGLEAPGTRGKCGMNLYPSTTNQSCMAFTKVPNIDTHFLFYWYIKYSSPFYFKYAQGTKQQSFNNSIVEKFPIIHPSLLEQQKIASFLSAADQRIQLLTQKKEKLEQYKKGIMQQIFSQQLRFKNENGQEYPEWEEKRLIDVCEKRSSNISANNLGEITGDYKIYGATGFLQNVNFYHEEDPYISIVKDGAGVGRVLICEGFSSVLGTLDIIKVRSGNNLYFLFTLLTFVPFKKYITGSTIPHIYFKDYSKEIIFVPCLPEQQKIASFLSSIDQKITLVNQQIELTRKWKQGLLQKMFV